MRDARLEVARPSVWVGSNPPFGGVRAPPSPVYWFRRV